MSFNRIIITKGIRILLTVTILFFIWLNTHWSIALFATLISVKIELEDIPMLRSKWAMRNVEGFLNKIIKR